MLKKTQAHARALGRIRVRYGVDKLDRSAFTNNVSRTGAFLRTNMVYPPGKTIKAQFNFDSRVVVVHAKVVWAKQVPPKLAHLLHCGMGLRFISPGSEWSEAFESWESRKSSHK